MYKKIIIILMCLLFLCCTDTNEINFKKLHIKFLYWHDSNFNEDFINNCSFDKILKSEFINDLKRFKFEFSQIRENELNFDNKLKYNMINNKINHLLLNYDTMNSFLLDPSILFQNMYEKLFSILSNERYSKLNSIEPLADKISKKYNNIYPGVNHRINLYIDKILFLLSKNIELNKIGTHNTKLIEIRNDVKSASKWIENNLSVNDKIINQTKVYIYEEQTKNVFHKQLDYKYDEILKFIDFQIKSVQNKIFNLSLPIYLKDNDEPVWIDREDSLNIISDVLNNKSDKLYNDLTICIDFESPDMTYVYWEDADFLKEYNSEINYKKCDNAYGYHSSKLNKNNNLNFDESSNFALNELYFKISMEKLSNNKVDSKIYYYFNKLRFFTKLLLKHKYIYEDFSKKEGVDFLKTIIFYDDKYAEIIWEEIIYPDNYYLDKYLATVKLNEIYDQNCIIKKKYTDKEFINKIKDFSSIPFNFFNEIIY